MRPMSRSLLDRKLKKHGGDAHAGLAEVTTDPVRQSLAGVANAEVRQSLAFLTPPPQGHVLLGTTDFVPPCGSRPIISFSVNSMKLWFHIPCSSGVRGPLVVRW